MSELVDVVVCQDGQEIRVDELMTMVPFITYLTTEHIGVCERIADIKKIQGSARQVYVNLLASHSAKAKTITALVTLIRQSVIEPSAIRCSYMSRLLLNQLCDVERVEFDSLDLTDVNFVDHHHYKRLVLKWGMHRAYRLLFKRWLKAPSAIRTWVEISRNMFGAHYESSIILIYPFTLNVKRHIRYIIDTFKQEKKVTFCGLPYRLSDILGAVFQPHKRDHHIVQFESNAYQKHGRELANMGIEQLYTSDEFEAGSAILCNKLHDAKIKIENKAHGLGFVSPYIDYDQFYVYNSGQLKYYQHKSPQVSFEVLPRKNAKADERVANVDADKPHIVYLDGNFEASGLVYESQLQQKILEQLRLFADNSGLPVSIKTHPNLSRAQSMTIEKASGLPTFKNLKSLSGVQPIFITIISAAFYDFREMGPFLFVSEELVPLDAFYGEQVNITALDGLHEALSDVINKPQAQELIG
jgi:hypothetical protein